MKFDIQDCFKKIQDVPCVLRVGNPELCAEPVVSVVIPTFKRPDLLKQTIESAIAQDDFNCAYEIIVVDNDDADGINETEKMLAAMNVSNLLYYKNTKNIGASGNWNRCILLARSNWVIMCHDDDLLKRDCIATMSRIISIHADDRLPLGYVRSTAESFFENGIYPVERKKRKQLPKKRTALIKYGYKDVVWGGGATWAGAPTCGTLINRKAALEVGGYNAELSPCCDCYLPYHMLGKYRVYKTYHSLGRYRWSENDTYRKSTLVNLIAAYNEFLEILSRKHWIVRFFSNEHYADCVMYYRKKGKEANVEISDEEINSVRKLSYSTVKLKVLYLCRRINSGIKVLAAK